MSIVAVIITTLTFVVVPTNMFTQWQISKGNLKFGYPLLMLTYSIYIILETIVAFNEPSQISLLLLDAVNLWGFIMAFRGYRRIKAEDNVNK